MARRANLVWRFTKSLPVLGSYLLVANAYAFKGNSAFVLKLAPPSLWLRRVLLKPSLCLAMAAGLHYFRPAINDQLGPVKDVISVFPNLLGFAVALYGLVLAIPSGFWRTIRQKRDVLDFAPETINADFAFPILTLIIILLAAWLAGAFLPSSPFIWAYGAFLFLYGIALLIELVTLIFFTTHSLLREKGGP